MRNRPGPLFCTFFHRTRLLMGFLLVVLVALAGCSAGEGRGEKDEIESRSNRSRQVSPTAASDPVGRPSGQADQGRDERHARRLEDREKSLAKSPDGRTLNEPVPPASPRPVPAIGTPSTPSSSTPKGKDVPRKDTKPKPPQVWHRDGSRPSVARVYVGAGNSLELVSMHVSVVVEGPRARTLVDHVFRNPHDRQLEGTFEYPLPSGASPCYYAMFLGQARDSVPVRFKPQAPQAGGKPVVLPDMLAPAQLARQIDTADWGKLQEARVVAPQRAREVYEEIVRGRVDPALLEYASGNTFRGRVFPIAPRGYNRVLLAYEETLPVTGGQLVHRFGLPGTKLHELRYSLQAPVRECHDVTFQPKDARKETTDDHVIFTRTWSDTTPKGDILFTARPTDPLVQASSGKHGDRGPLYLYARVRPELPKVAREDPFARHAIFLLDTSLSEFPDRFGVMIKLLRQILEADAEIQHFNILTFNAGAAWVEPKGWLPNTREGRDKALARLDGLVLEGATDLSSALEKVVDPGFAIEKNTPLACFLLSDGHLTWGETAAAPLVARFRKRCLCPTRFFCYRTGLGEENAELFDALTRDGGGVFQCHGEHEVAAVARAHRRQCLVLDRVRITGDVQVRELLVGGKRSAVYPDGELIVTGHFAKPGKVKIHLEGQFQGQKFAQSYPAEVRADGELAPRGWGEVAVAALLSLDDPWTEDLVTAYCQEFNVASRAGSFLVLESEADYKRFALDEQKGKIVKGDLDTYLESVWSQLSQEPSIKQAFGRLLFQVDAQTKVLSARDGQVKKVLELLAEEDCALPVGEVKGAILHDEDVNRNYLQARDRDRRGVTPHLEECARRYNEGDVDGAVRVLSSVIEQHPSSGDALRLVGYRLLDMRQPAIASRLFGQVLKQRPFEPHSYRDLARSLEDAGKQPLAALLYEAVLAGTWHNRFGNELKVVTREDYARSLRAGLREGKLSKDQKAFFEKRFEELRGSEPAADLRVSITWNTDATDIDLWVIEPDRTKVFYSAPRSRSGGELSQDQTQGYGPERYHIRSAKKGEYAILVHYYRANRNLLGGETHVNVTITRHAGTDREKVERRTVILRREGEQVEVSKVRH